MWRMPIDPHPSTPTFTESTKNSRSLSRQVEPRRFPDLAPLWAHGTAAACGW